jgi:hypothetical protein
MKNNYYVLISYRKKGFLKNFHLYDENKSKLYNGGKSIGVKFESIEKSLLFSLYYDLNVLISKQQFDDFLKLNFNELSDLSFKEIVEKLELQEWLI